MTPTPRTRQYSGTDRQTLLIEGVPRALVQAALEKAKREEPPATIKRIVIRLLLEFIAGEADIL